MPAKRIAILIHKEDTRFDSIAYLLKLLMKEWETMGHSIQIVRGIGSHVSADIVIPHLDMTVRPTAYSDFLSHYPLVVNRRVVDISKSKISTNIIKKGDDYPGPVIVKTDRNYAGLPEMDLGGGFRASQPVLSKITNKVFHKLLPKFSNSMSWKHIQSFPNLDYPVFQSLRDVPEGVFKNKNLVVEKFLPEVEKDHYCLRNCYFFGDKDISILARSNDKVIKGENNFQFEEVPIPPGIHRIRAQLGFDYGKFDYVLQNEDVVLFDANWTPGSAFLEASQFTKKVVHHLAGGILSLSNLRHRSGYLHIGDKTRKFAPDQ